mgnify:CR=1 FL=1
MNKENMDTVIDLGSSKVTITTFDQKKKVASVEINKFVTSFNFKNLNLEKKFYDL